MKLYNSLTNKKELFKPVKEKHLTMYVCGPTVYSYIHIGNARPVIFFDVVRRYFEFIGYKVKYVSNITDIDDKIIVEAHHLNITEKELTTFFTEKFLEDTDKLNSLRPTIMPKATDYVAEMIFYINDLIEKDYAYFSGDSVYFKVDKIKDYGKLSNQVLKDLNVGARIDENKDKKSPYDFTLWKNTDFGINFESPWGEGRPGWHTECSCMAYSIFGEVMDIHGGGNDLKFPHHENEVAQSEAISGHSLANYWMHVGRLDFNKTKMSKSLGNVILVKDLLKEYPYQAFRLMTLAHPYRQPIHFSYELMNQFLHEWQRIERALKQAFVDLSVAGYSNNKLNDQAINLFKEALEDDFNTPNAITVIHDQVRALNKTKIVTEQMMFYQTIIIMLDILGINLDHKQLTKQQIQDYKAWQTARKEKRYSEADEIRIRLVEQGIL